MKFKSVDRSGSLNEIKKKKVTVHYVCPQIEEIIRLRKRDAREWSLRFFSMKYWGCTKCRRSRNEGVMNAVFYSS